MICQKCDSEIPDQARVCDFCGARQEIKVKSTVNEQELFEEVAPVVLPASFAKRGLNFLVDLFVTGMLFSFSNSFLNIISEEQAQTITLNPDQLMEELDVPMITLTICILFFLYTFIGEFFFGKTIGKFLTRTRVISTVGKLTVTQLVVRTLFKLTAVIYNPVIILFIISYFFIYPKRSIHDQLSKTLTVED